MALQVAILPGVMGTELYVGLWGRSVKYWLNPPILATTGLGGLALNDIGDGPLPGPGGLTLEVTTGFPMRDYYGPLSDHLLNHGFDILSVGYDWRQSIFAAATSAAKRIMQFFSAGPWYLVAHSLGGLVARGVLKLLPAADRDRCQRLVTMASPHYGSCSIPRLFAHLDSNYHKLGLLMTPHGAITNTFPRDQLDKVIATLFSVYSLMPFENSPIFSMPGGATYAQLMDPATYAGVNGFLKSARFNQAKIDQTWIADAIFPEWHVSFIGVGTQTPVRVMDPGKIGSAGGYAYTQDGDNTVDIWSGTLQDTPTIKFSGVKHNEFPQDPAPLAQLVDVLLKGP